MANHNRELKVTHHKTLYWTWSHIKNRCNNPKDPAYSFYGGRGVKVCDRWLDSVKFIEDVLPTYEKGKTLDRIDNNGDYSPDNFRWSTPKEQANNTRRNRIITIKGITKTLAAWIDESDMKSSTVRQRFYVLKWSIEDALFQPKGTRLITRKRG